jgi:hypothetical protein
LVQSLDLLCQQPDRDSAMGEEGDNCATLEGGLSPMGQRKKYLGPNVPRKEFGRSGYTGVVSEMKRFVERIFYVDW